MKTKRVVVKTVEAAFGDNPDWMALIVSDENEQVELVFETTGAPALAASIILASQKPAKSINPNSISRNLEASMQILPEAVDISLACDGDVLCINVGSGALFFRLTDPAKRALNKPLKNIGTL